LSDSEEDGGDAKKKKRVTRRDRKVRAEIAKQQKKKGKRSNS
jgi:hypothetical protein